LLNYQVFLLIEFIVTCLKEQKQRPYNNSMTSFLNIMVFWSVRV
jgi:hypothetical protein